MGDENHQNEKEAMEIFGKKPAPYYKYNIHEWYDPEKGEPRC